MFTILDNKSYAEIKKCILDIFAKDPKRSCLSIAKQFNKSVSTIKRYKKEYLDFINTGKEIILSHKNVNNKNAQKYSDETIYNLGEVYQGNEITIKTLDGDVKVKLPKGISSKETIKISNKGLYKQVNRDKRGDLFIEINIAVPRNLSNKEKELIQSLSENSSFEPKNIVE